MRGINYNSINELNNDGIRAYSRPNCYICGAKGQILYQGLRDRLYNAPGRWNFRKCSDSKCGLIWVDPMPIEEDIAKLYEVYFTHDSNNVLSNNWTYIRNVYQRIKRGYLTNQYGYLNDKSTFFYKILGRLMYLHPARRADLDSSVFYLKSKLYGSLLEIGCGTGSNLESMQKLGWRVEGVDFDSKAVQIAQDKGLNIHLGTLADQKFPDNTFDAVAMNHLIEHVLDPYHLLRECHQILKLGGYLVIITPNTSSWGHKRYRSDWLNLDPPRHFHLFNSQLLLNLVQKSGFQIYNVITTIRYADSLFLACRAIKKSGRYKMDSLQPRFIRSWAKAMQFMEWMLLKVNPYISEEIALIAKKS